MAGAVLSPLEITIKLPQAEQSQAKVHSWKHVESVVEISCTVPSALFLD